MILSFLMMMTSGFSGITGNWLDLDWWLHCFFIYVFQQRLISQWTGSMDQKIYRNRHRQKVSEESNSQVVFMPTNITTKITRNKYRNFNSKLYFEINSDFSFWFYVAHQFSSSRQFTTSLVRSGFQKCLKIFSRSKTVPNESSSGFRPDKQTFILIHSWTKGLNNDFSNINSALD